MNEKQYKKFREYITAECWGDTPYRVFSKIKQRDPLINFLWYTPVVEKLPAGCTKPQGSILQQEHALLTILHMLGVRA